MRMRERKRNKTFRESLLMFLFVPSSFLFFLILQCIAQFLDENRENFIQGVHHASLKPLRNRSSCVMEAEFLQDVVHSHRIDFPTCPRNQPAMFIKHGGIIQCLYGKPALVDILLCVVAHWAWFIKLEILYMSVYTGSRENPVISEKKGAFHWK